MMRDHPSVASRGRSVSPAGSSASSRPVPPKSVVQEAQSTSGTLASRGNALRHGLTARALLPRVFQEGEIQDLLAAFEAEWQPAAATERVLVEELARHAAALGRAHEAEGAVLRESACSALGLWPIDDASDDSCDRVLAGSVTTDGVERLTRYRRAHEKGFFAALVKLREAKALRQRPAVSLPIWNDPFKSEADCATYLLRRWQRKDCECPHCGARFGYWLSGRQRWQCATCRHQVGVRAGTVMAGSHLPLVTWFSAIRLIVQSPTVSYRVLSKVIATRRPATIRRLGAKIRAALRSRNASALLAGLDRVFGGATHDLLNEASSEKPYLQNEISCPDGDM
jgi:transposase-like protein